MAKTLQFRRGTTSEISAITGAVGELFVDTTKDTVVVMDGSTAGGFPLARESALSGKQATLVSGTTIKTINGTSILGSGDLVISGGGGASYDQDLNTTDDVVFNALSIASGSPAIVIGTPTSGEISYYPSGSQISVGSGSTNFAALSTYAQTLTAGSHVPFSLVHSGTTYKGYGIVSSVSVSGSSVAFLLDLSTPFVWDGDTGGTLGVWDSFSMSTVTNLSIGGGSVTSFSANSSGVEVTGTLTLNGVSISGSGGGGSVGSGGDVSTLTIGDIYYANNILTPIPTITTTSYGTVTNYPPVVVNSTLNVLSSDASESILFTLSGADLSGSQSGGTNNFGSVNAGISNVNAKGQVKFTIQKPSDNCITVFKQLRQGDVITTVATNGFYTGTVSMTLTSLQLGKRRDVGGQYGPDIGEHGFVQIIGRLTDVNNAPVGSDLNFNANIIKVTRPYNASVVAGGLKPTYLDSPQVVADNLIVNKKLDVYEAAYLGATYSRTQGTYHAVGQFFGGQNIQIEGYKTDFMYISVTGTNSYPIDFGWNMRDPISEGYSRTITIMMTADSNFSLTLAHGGANTVVEGDDPDHISYAYYYVPTFWKDNSYPTQITAGRTLEMKFKFVANGEGGFSGLFCEWKEYY